MTLRKPWLTIRLTAHLLALFMLSLGDFAAGALARRVVPYWDAQAAERSFRIRSKTFHHHLASNVDRVSRWGGLSYPYRTNSLGFRDGIVRTISAERTGHRILVLGDSFTEGVGVPYPETYVGHLSELGAAHEVEVLNAGVSSYSPIIYFRKGKYYLEEHPLQIDAFVVALDLSDIPDEAMRYRFDSEGNVRDAFPPPLRQIAAEWLVAHSFTANLTWRLILAYERLGPRGALGLDKAQTGWERDDEEFSRYGAWGLKLAAEHMDSVATLAARHNVRLFLVIYPWPDEVVARDPNSRHPRFWREWAAARGIPLIDLFPVFIGPEPPESTIARYYFSGDSHWNVAGHRVVAHALMHSVLGEYIATRPTSNATE